MAARALLITCVMIAATFTGCVSPEDPSTGPSGLIVDLNGAAEGSVEVGLGRVANLSVQSNTEYTIVPGPSIFVQDADGVHRLGNVTFDASVDEVRFLVVDSEAAGTDLVVRAGDEEVEFDLVFADQGIGLVDGERAYDTIDYLTSNHNNRWCADADFLGLSDYDEAAEAMEEAMWDMGFDHVEITNYPDDPAQKNIVGYNWGRVNPDEYIVVGGHFDIAYALTPPGGGTQEGANDDTSGSVVSLEMAQALAKMEFDHTVVAALWACEEEGLLGSLAFVANLPENVSVRSYLNFDMVALNYPILPVTAPLVGPGGEIFSPTVYDWSISIAGASDSNMNRMIDWVATTIEVDLASQPTEANPIEWQIAESCASDHCAFFSAGYPTFNFFSPGGDISFWQEWHSPSDTLEFMTAKAGGQEGMESGFNSLVWVALDLFIRIDNAEDFHGNWME